VYGAFQRLIRKSAGQNRVNVVMGPGLVFAPGIQKCLPHVQVSIAGEKWAKTPKEIL